MHITPHGAAREVTGSCHRVETKKTRVLIDCGMFQGSAFSDARNFQPFGFEAKDVDAVLITHTHLDHVGRLPKLVHEGFNGPIFATKPTARLLRIILEDAYQIMEEQFESDYRPKLYEFEDLRKTIDLVRGVEYSRWKALGDIRFRFRDAGHIFGSSFVEIEETDGVRAVFSGDIGNVDTPILRPTAQIGTSDVVFVESTYGNRIHEDIETRSTIFLDAVKRTMKQKGVLLIPAFAIERTQALLYDLNHFFEHQKLPPIDVYLDSPMAIHVTEVMEEFPEYYDQAAAKLVMDGDNFFDFPSLHLTLTRSESKRINEVKPPKIIIAGSGMMNAGRIQHHLLRYLSKTSTTLFIVGYQASGTLGRRLYTGERHVRVLNEMIDVKANVITVGSFSAHGDQKKLLHWIGSAQTKPKRVYCVHGEDDACVALATAVSTELNIKADAPHHQETIEL
ncbi:MAG: MBL fold metallo-hydrolase [Candidatus Uhrbacteria bacterium]|nr:MBL fold metallo-hydrolase [Candidatus Uhrbacteria bacterium]